MIESHIVTGLMFPLKVELQQHLFVCNFKWSTN